MALSMIVSIPDLDHIYMKPMETASSKMCASGPTYSPQCGYISPHQDVEELPGALSQLSHYSACNGVMPWPCPWL